MGIFDLLTGNVLSLVVILGLLFMFFSSAVRVVQEYERGVVFRLGRLVGARGPGLILLIPGSSECKRWICESSRWTFRLRKPSPETT